MMKRLATALALILLLFSTSFAGEKDGRLDVYWVDVEGGAATLIVTPAGESVLIDTGNPGQRDPGRIALVATRVAGLQAINHLIITHYHGDHFGGAAMLAKLLPIQNVYDNGEFDGQPNFPSKEYQTFKCEKRIVINPGDELPLKQAESDKAAPVSIRCLGTRKTFIEAAGGAGDNAAICATNTPKNRDGSDNANSVVTLIGFGPFRFFDGGDLTWNQEMRLVCPVNLVGRVDVYQVTHHGLDSSNNPVVLQSLEPTVAIMNNGVTKGCMPEVFANLKATKSLQAIYQLHKNERPDGNVNNVADEFIANRQQDCQGHYVHLSVAPDGKTYTVSIPAHGHTQTYKTRLEK